MAEGDIVREYTVDGERMYDVEIAKVNAPIEADDWDATSQRAAIVEEVLANREAFKLTGPDTSAEAKRLDRENALPEGDFDPTDFGDETIAKPPKAE